MIQPRTGIVLRDLTTLRVGGPVEFYAEAHTAADIVDLVNWARQRNNAVCVLGRGSNVLASDRGWAGLVVDTSKRFSGIEWSGDEVVCDAGTLLSVLVKQSVDRALAGMERLAGIPGTVGGAVIMNAGAFGQEISYCLKSVEILAPGTGTVAHHVRQNLMFGYRTSSLKQCGALVLRARFRLAPGDGGQLAQAYGETHARRKAKQPLDLPNCGSVFKRPPGHYAGELIEQAGLKGLRVGDAMVSSKHANFIVNTGDARAEDVRALIAQIQKKVFLGSGVLLEPEVIFVGEFDTPLYEPAHA